MNRLLSGNDMDLLKKKKFPSVDIAKLICAYLVVSIHVNVFGTGGIVTSNDIVHYSSKKRGI